MLWGVVNIANSQPTELEPRVTVSGSPSVGRDPLRPTQFDIPAESAISDLRIALLRHEVVEDALLALADKRAAFCSRQPKGDNYWQCIALTARTLQVFSEAEIDYFASIIRGRMQLGVWGLCAPVGGPVGGRYGRLAQRARSVAPGTVTVAAEALARRLEVARSGGPDRTEPGWMSSDDQLAVELGYDRSNVRQAVHRAVRIATAS